MVKIIYVNSWPIASKTAIGYMCEHIFNNKELFDIMEIHTSDVEVYTDITERYLCKINPIVIKPITPQFNFANTVPADVINGNILKYNLKYFLKRSLPIILNPFLKKKVLNFNPDVIYTNGYDIRILRLANRLAKMTGARLIIHTLDDWFTSNNKYFEKLNRKLLNKILSNSQSIAVSPAMAERIKSLFGCESFFITNCSQFNKTHRTEILKNASSDILYIGNLTPSRYKTLASLAQKLKEKYPLLKIDVYSPTDQITKYGKYLPDNIHLNDAVGQSQVRSLIESAKIALHIESFDDDCRNFIKYSLSTKISEYSACGIPLVYFGPSDVGVAQFIKEKNMGDCFEDSSLCAEKIGALLNDEGLYVNSSKQCLDNGRKYFDVGQVQDKMHSIMNGKISI